MSRDDNGNDRSTREAIALWHGEGCRSAADADIAAFLDDANALAREEDARDHLTDPMITRRVASLPAAFTGVRLFDGITGDWLGSHLRAEPIHPQPDARSVQSLLSGRNTFSRMLGRHDVAAWQEQPFQRFEFRSPELPGILDVWVFGGVTRVTTAT